MLRFPAVKGARIVPSPTDHVPDLGDRECLYSRLHGESVMSNQEHPRVALKLIPTPWAQHIISAPPILIASTNTVDYVCGDCGAVLMHAERGQVHNLVIHCTGCGSYNSTDA